MQRETQGPDKSKTRQWLKCGSCRNPIAISKIERKAETQCYWLGKRGKSKGRLHISPVEKRLF